MSDWIYISRTEDTVLLLLGTDLTVNISSSSSSSYRILFVFLHSKFNSPSLAAMMAANKSPAFFSEAFQESFSEQDQLGA